MGSFSSNESFDDLDQLDDLLHGRKTPTDAEKAQTQANQTWALQLIDNFRKRTSPGVWPNCNRQRVADDLAVRVKDASKINQSHTWLCGVTSVVKAWANDCPVDYAWLGIELFEHGRGRMGRGKFLGEIIEPTLDLRRSQVSKDMPHGDWIVLASVHETLARKSGMLGNDNYSSDEGFLHARAWQTAGEVMAAFKAGGYKNVVDNTSYMSHKGVNDLELANEYLKKGYRVSLLTNMRLLDDKQIGTQALVATSNHWIGMTEPFIFGGDTVCAFNVFSWGEIRRVPQDVGKKTFPVRDLLVDFYGFVAARAY